MNISAHSTADRAVLRVSLKVGLSVAAILAVGGVALGRSHIGSRDAAPAVTAEQAHFDPSPAARRAETADVFRFTNLPDMVVNSDLVVVGSIVRAEKGRIFNPEDGEAALTAIQLTIRSERVLFGEQDGPIVVEEVGWEGGVPLIINGATPPAEGDRGVFFLRRTQRDSAQLGYPVFNFVSSQGRLTELPPSSMSEPQAKQSDDRRPGQQLRGSNSHDELVSDLEMMSIADIESEVQRATSAIQRGEYSRWPTPPMLPVRDS